MAVLLPLFGPEGLGLDSIDALELVVGLEKHFGVKASEFGRRKAGARLGECTARLRDREPAVAADGRRRANSNAAHGTRNVERKMLMARFFRVPAFCIPRSKECPPPAVGGY